MRTTRITITRITIPEEKKPNLNLELQYLCAALGLFNQRDKDRSKFRIFIELLRSAKKNEGRTSDELAAYLHLTRATVIHHLHNLASAGIIDHKNNKYYLRVNSLSELVAKVRRDLNKTFDELAELAERCDKGLGL